MTSKLIAASLTIALLGTTAFADDMGRGGHRGMHGPMMDFATVDANGDGELTLEEVQAVPQTMFASADTNGDGGLSIEEMTAHAQERAAEHAEKMLEKHDENGDGMIQMGEMPHMDRMVDRADRMFDRMDADDSGTISQEEFEAAKAHMGERGHGRGHGGKGHGNHGDMDKNDG